jgi:glycerol uptake facilitator-like aquaporin
MKVLKQAFLLVVLVMLVSVTPALAQDGSLPDTAVEGLAVLLAFIGTVAGVGHLTNIFLNALKDLDERIFKIDLLDPEQELHISGYLAEIAALLIAAVLGWAATEYLQPFTVWLDQVGLWPVIAAGWAMARQIYAGRK